MEYGVRQLIPELGCAATLRVVVDTSGVHIGGALRMRGVFQRVGHVLDRMYPCRLHVSIVGPPVLPLQETAALFAMGAMARLFSTHAARCMPALICVQPDRVG